VDVAQVLLRVFGDELAQCRGGPLDFGVDDLMYHHFGLRGGGYQHHGDDHDGQQKEDGERRQQTVGAPLV
jgi:hypothetical protein